MFLSNLIDPSGQTLSRPQLFVLLPAFSMGHQVDDDAPAGLAWVTMSAPFISVVLNKEGAATGTSCGLFRKEVSWTLRKRWGSVFATIPPVLQSDKWQKDAGDKLAI